MSNRNPETKQTTTDRQTAVFVYHRNLTADYSGCNLPRNVQLVWQLGLIEGGSRTHKKGVLVAFSMN